MARDDRDMPQDRVELLRPRIALRGEVGEAMLGSLIEGLQAAEQDAHGGDVTVEVCTVGGDAEIGRRMMLEVDLFRRALAPRRLLFLGKTTVYSAGTTLMAAFPREDRILTSDATLMIHCRQLEQTLQISGPIRSSLPKIEALLHQIEAGIEQETANFERLIEGSDVTMDELLGKALYNWYLPAREALERGLIGAIADTGVSEPGQSAGSPRPSAR